MADYVLGLDLGPNSIGWALVACVEEKDGSLREVGLLDTSAKKHLPMGARVFEAGLANFDSSKEMSLNQTRRQARSARRIHARRNARRYDVRDALQEAKLLPKDEQELQKAFQTDPYALRAKALHAALAPHELGRVIYHMSQRRGFQTNRKNLDKKADGQLYKETGELEAKIKEADCTTLGAFLHKEATKAPLRLERGEFRIRGIKTLRSMYKTELDAVITAQRQHHKEALTDDLVKRLRDAIFYQHNFDITEDVTRGGKTVNRTETANSRANLHRAPSLKKCALTGEYCCPNGEYVAQQFRILKEVNNLAIEVRPGDERPLSQDMRDMAIKLLSEQKDVTFDRLRKEFSENFDTPPDARFNLERGKREKLKGNAIDYALAKVFGKARSKRYWGDLPDTDKDGLRRMLCEATDPEQLRSVLLRHGIEDTKLVNELIGFEGPGGYSAYSKIALDRMVPFLKEGKNEHDARNLAFPDQREPDQFESLPALIDQRLPDDFKYITNPIVRRAVVETRKVVNAIIREHGLPRQIVVELAREMKGSGKERSDMRSRQSEQEKRRKKAEDEVARLGGNPGRRDDIDLYMMWQEQGEACPYTGAPISQGMLSAQFVGKGGLEVDHILPHWRSLDDSYMNKVLCLAAANAEKSDRTPHEWLAASDMQRYDEMLRRVAAMCESGINPMPWSKYNRFKQTELKTDAFAARQLNDTRYISTLVVKYLALLYPQELRIGEKSVRSSRGGLTAELRRHWGLNGITSDIFDGKGEKIRDDHRHHAVDALVVALSSRANLKKYQDYWKKGGSKGLAPWDEKRRRMDAGEFPEPWDKFRASVKGIVDQINVSHRPMRKLAGAFHEAKYYGAVRDRQGKRIEGKYVYRLPLSELTGSSVHEICDGNIKKLIIDRLVSKGWDGESNDLPENWVQQPIVMKGGIPVRKVRVFVNMKDPADLGHRFAIKGNNHHMEVIGSGEARAEKAAVVPMLDVAKRIHSKEKLESVVKDWGDDGRTLMTLFRKDSIRVVRPDTGEKVVCVVQMMSGSPSPSTTIDLYLRDARDSRPASIGNKSPFKRFKSVKSFVDYKPEKVQIDPLGRIFPDNS